MDLFLRLIVPLNAMENRRSSGNGGDAEVDEKTLGASARCSPRPGLWGLHGGPRGIGLLVLGSAVFLSACTAQDRTVEITAQEFRFVPSVIQVTEGRRVRLRLRNQGHEVHTFHAPLLFVPSHTVTWISPDRSFEAGGAVVLQPGETVELSLEPRAGVYAFRCWIKGHAGMEGTLIVKTGKN